MTEPVEKKKGVTTEISLMILLVFALFAVRYFYTEMRAEYRRANSLEINASIAVSNVMNTSRFIINKFCTRDQILTAQDYFLAGGNTS